MTAAAKGDTVRVHYTGTLESGAEFDSSRQRDPMQVVVGGGQVLEDFENALVGMSVGDVKSVVIAPEGAYGVKQDAMKHTVARNQMPPDLDIRLGMTLEATGQQGEAVQMRVVGVDDDNVVLDMNHPLAGETLTFEIEMMAIDEV